MELRIAEARARSAELQYGNLGAAEESRKRALARSTELQYELARLNLMSDTPGVVMTARLQDAVGRYRSAGEPLAEIGEVSLLRARVYLPEYAVREVRTGQFIALMSDASTKQLAASVSEIAPAATEEREGLLPPAQYQGIQTPSYYVVAALLANPKGELQAGATGTAKIWIGKQSIAGWIGRTVKEFALRKFW
jgi:multidrug resistance efflux pump